MVRFVEPVGDRWLDFVAVADLNDVEELGLRGAVDAEDLRSLQRATEEDAEFEKALLGTHEEVTGFAREHDGFVRGVNALIAEGGGGFAQALPSVAEIFGEILGESGFGGGPTVVRFAFFDPLLAVVAVPSGHSAIVCEGWATSPQGPSCSGQAEAQNIGGVMSHLKVRPKTGLWGGPSTG